MLNYGMKICQNRAIVKDSIQEIFVDIWEKRSQLGYVQQPQYYLLKALRNNLIRYINNHSAEPLPDTDAFLDQLTQASHENSLIQHESQAAQHAHIHLAINKLPARQAEAIYLRYSQGLSLDQLAEIMNLPKQVIKNLLSKAKALLRVSLRNLMVLMLFCKFF
jgi:RNA polymerase sigma factor (sigma-70 family)